MLSAQVTIRTSDRLLPAKAANLRPLHAQRPSHFPGLAARGRHLHGVCGARRVIRSLEEARKCRPALGRLTAYTPISHLLPYKNSSSPLAVCRNSSSRAREDRELQDLLVEDLDDFEEESQEFTKKTPEMSSLSRRACYKCGNVGHYAEVCSSSERLCYNCKQPGHESNGCPHPRTTETKQCYHCQGLGHVQADCPTLRLSGAGTSGRCYSCGQPGHLARSCPNPAGGMGRGAGVPRGGYGGGFRGGFAGGPRPATCYKCGGPNHFARDCQAQAMKCYACGKLGHISRDCTAPNGGPLNTVGKTCYRCGEAGHISRECPQAEVNGDGLGAAPQQAPVQPPAPTTAVA